MEDVECEIKGVRCSSGVHWEFGLEHSDRTGCVWAEISLVAEWEKGKSRNGENQQWVFITIIFSSWLALKYLKFYSSLM